MTVRRPAGEATPAERVLDGVRQLVDERLVVATTGNVSARSQDGLVITPSRAAYRAMREEDLVAVDAEGATSPPGAIPSLELPLHRAVYAARPDVGAVVHTHSPYATAWSTLRRPLEPALEDIDYYALGTVRTCTGAAGSDELAAAVAGALAEANGVLLHRHGVVAVAPTVALAVDRAAAIEHVAQVAWLLRAGPALR